MASRCVPPGVHVVRLAAFAAFAASCGGGGGTKTPAVDKAACKAQVADLVAFLNTRDPSPRFAVDADVHLVIRPTLPSIERRDPMVTLTATGPRFHEQRYGFGDLGPPLVHEKLRLDDMVSEHRFPEGKIDSRHVLLMIDAATTWGDVVKLTDMLTKVGFDLPTFVLGKSPPVAPPPRVPVDDELDKQPDQSGDAATAIATALSAIIATCPAMKTVFRDVGGADGDDKGKVFIDASGPAVIACNCNLDMKAFRSVMWRIVGNPQPETGLAVTLASAGTAIALPAATLWSDAQNQLQPGTTVHLVAK